MPRTLQFRRGTTAGISTITGAEGELFVDLSKDTLVVMDGGTTGGQALQKEIVSSTNISAGIVTATSVSSPFLVNPSTVSASYTIPTNFNALSIGPSLAVNTGVVATVQTGARWIIYP